MSANHEQGTYWIDFEDNHYGGYSREEFNRMLSEGNFLSLVERPGVLGSGLQWVVECVGRLR